MSTFPSSRFSPAIESAAGADRLGFVKIRLGHSKNGSVFVVDQLYLADQQSWLFFQPSFFGPPALSFFPKGKDEALFSVDVTSPWGLLGARLLVRIKKSGLRKSYGDGSVLYWCSVAAPDDLNTLAAGRAKRLANGDFALRLYHHTDANGRDGILTSGHFKASSWNLQGVRKLVGVEHVYLTTLDRIVDDNDLARIAMSRAGTLHFQTTSEYPVEKILPLNVYRSNTDRRVETVAVWVPSDHIAPPHLYFHPKVKNNPAYYEVIGPEIQRIPVRPGKVVPIVDEHAFVVDADMMRFNAVILGHAGSLAGLKAPYDEEDSTELMFLEQLSTDIFEFWQDHANMDLVSGRVREILTVK